MANTKERTTIKVQAERAVLAAVRLPESHYDERDPFGELTSLAEQAGAVVVGHIEQRRQRPEASTYIGTGKLEELRGLCEVTNATTVIFDHDLSPRQIANIEKAVERKVLDRSELILDIFAGRATSHEAKLQVELAQLEYTYPRLRAMWSHLERIVGTGGIGGVGTRGPGEQQLEIDRRIVQRKKAELARELNRIHARKQRMVRDRKLDHYTVGLVGYTNAGKSTLFNSLTTGGAYADDRLFATLMTRTRQWDLGRSVSVMLSDTVGFVRDLPHHLVASFRATLEEATHADLLLIVLDVSDPAAELHFRTVMRTLDELFREVSEREARDPDAPEWETPKRMLLLNKVDLLEDNRELIVWNRLAAQTEGIIGEPIAMCARDPDPDGLGRLALRRAVLEAAKGGVQEVLITLPMSDGRNVQILENRAEVLDRAYNDGRVTMHVRIGTRQLAQLRSTAASLEVQPAPPSRRPGATPGADLPPETSPESDHTGVDNDGGSADTLDRNRHPSSVGRAELS